MILSVSLVVATGHDLVCDNLTALITGWPLLILPLLPSYRGVPPLNLLDSSTQPQLSATFLKDSILLPTMLTIFAAMALLVTAFLQGAAGAEDSTALGASSIFGYIMVLKMSYYRALAHATPLEWSKDLAALAATQANQCGLEYDVSTKSSSTPRLRTDKAAVLGPRRSNHLQHW